MPAAAVTPAEKAYTNIVAVKTLVVGIDKWNKKEGRAFSFFFEIIPFEYFKKMLSFL